MTGLGVLCLLKLERPRILVSEAYSTDPRIPPSGALFSDEYLASNSDIGVPGGS